MSALKVSTLNVTQLSHPAFPEHKLTDKYTCQSKEPHYLNANKTTLNEDTSLSS